MRKEYDLKKMKMIKNPYIGKLKKSVTIRLDTDVIDYFKKLSEQTNIPYQTLVNEFLRSCKEQKMTPKTIWKKSV
ncbi:MAG TPA: antitoxin [Bdellovibrionales bacterium]|nr:antitoxin [Pseudobdellovibrionaceae bacterium]HAG91891.1 antitoxin [Bdellovibrionales bacterium]|tara:strand:+ start:1395 stop:1619 length:225 start_codon:yes stop_codon:yes gene_type:complete